MKKTTNQTAVHRRCTDKDRKIQEREEEYLSRLREALNGSQEKDSDIAYDIGVSRQRLHNFKSGKTKKLTGISLMRLGERLNVALND